MCLIFAAYKAHCDYRLVIVANRDEFYSRPAAPAGFWPDCPNILAGRDLEARSTWMGVSTRGRFAALTNHRSYQQLAGRPPTRGRLVSQFIAGASPTDQYVTAFEDSAYCYNGFSLLLDDGQSLWYCSNRGRARARPLSPGIYGLSNESLDTPWPKVKRGKEAIKKALNGAFDAAELFKIMRDKTCAESEELPDTGIGESRERQLSSMFIETSDYGTRCSTVITITYGGRVRFWEKTYHMKAKDSLVHYEFDVGKSYHQT